MKINRIELIQKLIDKYDFKNYLEIGVNKGNSFLPIKCKNKVGVDPNFLISNIKKFGWLFRNTCNINNKYFQQTSDDFFNKNEEFLNSFGKIDIALIDGLHTFEASLKDVLNTLKYLNKNGFIIMHDCLPPNDGAAIESVDFPTEDERKKAKVWTGEWCGDVWKTIVYLKDNYKTELEVFVLNTDYGLGIVRIKEKIKNFNIIEDSLKKIKELNYVELIKDSKNMLGLTDIFPINF